MKIAAVLTGSCALGVLAAAVIYLSIVEIADGDDHLLGF